MAEIEDVYSDYTPVNNKIKVAYISNDFREHAVANFVIPFLRDYDKNLFEVHVLLKHSYGDSHFSPSNKRYLTFVH